KTNFSITFCIYVFLFLTGVWFMNTALPQTQNWGRAWQVSAFTFLSTLLIITTTPLMVFYFYFSCVYFQGSLLAPLQAYLSGELALSAMLPSFEWGALKVYLLWFALQVVLALFLPDFIHRLVPYYRGGQQKGAITPAGNQLAYNINGLQAWIVSHALFFAGAYYFNWFSPTIIADYWGPMLLLANLMGYAVALFVYIKSHRFPTSREDRKFSGNVLYDFYMGIEFNPRIGSFDFKLFFNGRPGIVAWTLINFSFAASQYAI